METEKELLEEFDRNQAEIMKSRGNGRKISKLNHRNSDIIDIIHNMRLAADKTPIKAV
jgi:hypothetical protein